MTLRLVCLSFSRLSRPVNDSLSGPETANGGGHTCRTVKLPSLSLPVGVPGGVEGNRVSTGLFFACSVILLPSRLKGRVILTPIRKRVCLKGSVRPESRHRSSGPDRKSVTCSKVKSGLNL